jgi:hypothetical protein
MPAIVGRAAWSGATRDEWQNAHLPQRLLDEGTRMTVSDTVKETWAKLTKSTEGAVHKSKEVAVGAYDKSKDVAGTAVDKTKEVSGSAVVKTKEVACKVDDKLEEHASREGLIGSAAGLGHKIVDKVDGD